MKFNLYANANNKNNAKFQIKAMHSYDTKTLWMIASLHQNNRLIFKTKYKSNIEIINLTLKKRIIE